jgi:hypothetical protein
VVGCPRHFPLIPEEFAERAKKMWGMDFSEEQSRLGPLWRLEDPNDFATFLGEGVWNGLPARKWERTLQNLLLPGYPIDCELWRKAHIGALAQIAPFHKGNLDTLVFMSKFFDRPQYAKYRTLREWWHGLDVIGARRPRVPFDLRGLARWASLSYETTDEGNLLDQQSLGSMYGLAKDREWLSMLAEAQGVTWREAVLGRYEKRVQAVNTRRVSLEESAAELERIISRRESPDTGEVKEPAVQAPRIVAIRRIMDDDKELHVPPPIQIEIEDMNQAQAPRRRRVRRALGRVANVVGGVLRFLACGARGQRRGSDDSSNQ